MKKILLALTLLGCGDSTGPEFPSVEGSYDYSATVNGLPGVGINGTLLVVDDGRDTAIFAGNFNVTLSGGGATSTSFTGQIVGGMITRDGTVQFDFEDSSYRHNGRMQSSSITGTYFLDGTDSDFSGNFVAVRR